MSIRDEIKRRRSEERLLWLPPLIPSESAKRLIFVSKEVSKIVMGPWGNTSEDLRFGRLRGDLDHFIMGGLITVAEDPFKKPRSTYMARLAPVRDELWDIRSRDPRPSIRVFGAFASTDTFIALTWQFRENLEGRDSRDWSVEIRKCKAA